MVALAARVTNRTPSAVITTASMIFMAQTPHAGWKLPRVPTGDPRSALCCCIATRGKWPHDQLIARSRFDSQMAVARKKRRREPRGAVRKGTAGLGPTSGQFADGNTWLL